MANKVQCAEKVWDGWHKHDCHRPAGYGEGAAYCKQHAKRYPSVDEVAAGEVKYWAEWEFSMPRLARVTVIGETERTFTITQKDDLIGSTYSIGQVKKSSGCLADNLAVACEWLAQVAAVRMRRAEVAFLSAQETAAEVQQMIERVKASEVQRGSTE